MSNFRVLLPVVAVVVRAAAQMVVLRCSGAPGGRARRIQRTVGHVAARPLEDRVDAGRGDGVEGPRVDAISRRACSAGAGRSRSARTARCSGICTGSTGSTSCGGPGTRHRCAASCRDGRARSLKNVCSRLPVIGGARPSRAPRATGGFMRLCYQSSRGPYPPRRRFPISRATGLASVRY